MNKRRQRYCNLGSIAEVQAERSKIHRYIRTNDKHLAEDWEDAMYEFTPENLMHRALGSLACRSSLVANTIAGVKAAMSFFQGRRKNDDACGMPKPKNTCGCE